EAVARLDLDGRCSFIKPRLNSLSGNPEKLFFRGRPGSLHGRNDPAACTRNLLVARALQAQLELVGAVSGIDEMGMAVYEPGRDPGAARIVLFARLAAPLAARPEPVDLSVADRDDPVGLHPVTRH